MAARFDTITFLSDYGTGDEFVGVVHSVIRSIAPARHGDRPHPRDPALRRPGRVAHPRPRRAVPVPRRGARRRRPRRRHARAAASPIEVGGGQSYLVGPDNGLLAGAVAMSGGRHRGRRADQPRLPAAGARADLRRPRRVRPRRRPPLPRRAARRARARRSTRCRCCPASLPAHPRGGRRPRRRGAVGRPLRQLPAQRRPRRGRPRSAPSVQLRWGDDVRTADAAPTYEGIDAGPGRPRRRQLRHARRSASAGGPPPPSSRMPVGTEVTLSAPADDDAAPRRRPSPSPSPPGAPHEARHHPRPRHPPRPDPHRRSPPAVLSRVVLVARLRRAPRTGTTTALRHRGLEPLVDDFTGCSAWRPSLADRPARRRVACAIRTSRRPRCARRRASCLLTGRNHHSVGMANITELASGFPGYNGASAAEQGRHRGDAP